MRPSMRLAAAVASVAGLLTARIASAGYAVSQTIVTSGSTVSGSAALSPSNPGEVFGAFSSTPAINNTGLVTFQAPVIFTGQVSSGALQNNVGIFSGGAGSVNVVAQAGYLAPTAAGGGTSTSWAGDYANNFSFTGAPIDAAGNIAITDTLVLTSAGGSNSSAGVAIVGTNNTAVWSDRSGSLSMVAQAGSTPLGATTLKAPSNVVQNPSGVLVYNATTNDTPATGGVIIDSAGTPAFVARGSTIAPGTSGANFSNGTFGAPVVNATGQVAFRSSLATGTYAGGAVITTANAQGIWKTVGGTVQLVAQAGTQAPGLATGDQFSSPNFSSPDFNNAGQTAFTDSLIVGSGDVTSGNSGAVWSEGGGTLHLVARDQVTTAPGTNGSVFNSSFGTPVINDSGKVAFSASFNGGTGIVAANNSGIFTESSGIISLIAQKGTQAPGFAAGVNLTSLAGLALNSQGNLAFSGGLSSGGSALFGQDASGTVTPLLYTGESLQISPGVFGNVSGFSLVTASGGEDGRALNWNDNNTLAVSVQFNTGGVVSSAVVEVTAVVPEPTSACVLLLASPLLLARRRRTNDIKAMQKTS